MPVQQQNNNVYYIKKMMISYTSLGAKQHKLLFMKNNFVVCHRAIRRCNNNNNQLSLSTFRSLSLTIGNNNYYSKKVIITNNEINPMNHYVTYSKQQSKSLPFQYTTNKQQVQHSSTKQCCRSSHNSITFRGGELADRCSHHILSR